MVVSRTTPQPSADEHVFVIDESLGYLLNYAAKLINRAHVACLAQHDITLGQWAVLLFLWHTDGLTQTQLSRRVALEDATMVRMIDHMERDGLVRRVRNPHDRRQLNIFLTDHGRALREVLIPCAQAGNAAAVRDLTDPERELLLSLLTRVITALEPAAPALP